MNRKQEKEEYLERVWTLKEEDKDSIDDLRERLGKAFRVEIVNELVFDQSVELAEEGSKIRLTKEGEKIARRLIRAHRLAERLIYDVLGESFESGACEFEHIMNIELLDSVCTLLGHPRECPHGMPIPEGECCRQATEIMSSSVISLTKLKVGRSARVAYVNCHSDQRLHKIDNLQIRPGAMVKVHQTYPTYVIECDGVNIALDEEIASDIHVWKEGRQWRSDGQNEPLQEEKMKRPHRTRFRRGRS